VDDASLSEIDDGSSTVIIGEDKARLASKNQQKASSLETPISRALLDSHFRRAGQPSPQRKKNETDGLALQLTEKFTEANKKVVIVMDLATAVGEPGTFWTAFPDPDVYEPPGR
jgi:hypothetical protein